jgi:hypothetical protein
VTCVIPAVRFGRQLTGHESRYSGVRDAREIGTFPTYNIAREIVHKRD